MVQARERQMSLGLDARGRQDLVASRPAMLSGGAQQRGLPDTGVAERRSRRRSP